MNARRAAGIVLPAIALVTTIAIAAGPSTATGASSDHDVWKGQEVTAAQAERILRAEGPKKFTLTTIPGQMEFVDLGVPDTSPGDFFMLTLGVFNEDQSKRVGRGVVRCEIAINTQNCHATFLLYHRGQLVIDGVFYFDREKVVLSIIGGTDEFRAASGLVRIINVDETQYLVFHLGRTP